MFPLASLEATWCLHGSECDLRWDCKLKHCGKDGFLWYMRGHRKSQAQMDLYADQERRGVSDVGYCPPPEIQFYRPPPTPQQIELREAFLRAKQELKEREERLKESEERIERSLQRLKKRCGLREEGSNQISIHEQIDLCSDDELQPKASSYNPDDVD